MISFFSVMIYIDINYRNSSDTCFLCWHIDE